MITRQKIRALIMRLVATLLLLFTCLVAVIAWIMTTESGLHYSIHLAEKFIPGKISALSINGRLTGPIIINNLIYKNETTSIHIENGKFDWDSQQLLLSKKLHITKFEFKKITVTLNTKKLKQSNTSIIDQTKKYKKNNAEEIQKNILNFSIPLEVSLPHASINTFELRQDNQSLLQANQIKLSATASQSSIRLKTTWSGNAILSLKSHSSKDSPYSNNQKAAWDLQWKLNIPKMSSLIPNATGNLSSTGSINTSHFHPIIKSTIHASSINTLINKKTYAIKKLDGDIYLNLAKLKLNSIKTRYNSHSSIHSNSISNNQSHIHLTASNINIHGSLINTAKINLIGDLEKNRIQIDIVNQSVDELNIGESNHHTQYLHITFTGGLKNSTFYGDITRFKFNYRPIGMWSLKNHSPIKIGEIDKTDKIGLANTKTISLQNLCLQKSNHQGIHQTICSSFSAILNTKHLTLNAKIDLGENQKILGNLSITHFDLSPSQQKLSGSINANYTNFSLINDLFPQVENAQGKLTSHIKINGSVENPQFIGQVQLSHASLDIPDFGLKIKKINITAQGDQKGDFNIKGIATSGPGQLHLSGNVAFNQKGIPVILLLQGNHISIINNGDYLINISPHLNIDKKFKNIAVTGKIKISKALIKPQDFGNSSVSLPDDVEFINGHIEPPTRYPLSGKITLDVGDHATINTHGLKGKLEGKLDINYNSETTTTAKGTLTITNGYYDAYGEHLQIKTGKLIFAGGPIDNPGLDIQAVRTILAEQTAQSTLGGGIAIPTSYSGYSKALVGVSVKGTLKNHKVSLISIPAIYSQSDILSLMLTGKTASGVSGNKAQLLLKAASALKLGGSSTTNITQQLQQSLGLDELGIKSETYAEGKTPLQTSSLVVGKRIFQKLFVSYSIGLLNPVSMLRVRYQFAKYWSLETSASTKTTGADLFYSIEK